MRKKEKGEPLENLRKVKRNKTFTTAFMALSIFLLVIGIREYIAGGMTQFPFVAMTGLMLSTYYFKTYKKQQGYIKILEEKIAEQNINSEAENTNTHIEENE